MRFTDAILTGALAVSVLVGCGSEESDPPAHVVVQIHTDGGDPDSSGYTLSIEGWGDTTIASTDTLRLEVPPGMYFLADMTSDELPSQAERVITLDGVSPNCQSTHSFGSYTFAAGATDTIGYSVHCTATTGTIYVKLVTTGVGLDPDGYQVAVDVGAPATLAVNTVQLLAIAGAGDHALTLSGVVMNCTPSDTLPTLIHLAPAQVDTVSWTVNCEWPRIVAKVQAGGVSNGIVLVNPDGTNEVLLYGNVLGEDPHDPAWSPTRDRILFDRLPLTAPSPARRVALGVPDSAPDVTLFSDDLFGTTPRWRPDGAAFLFIGVDSVGGKRRVFQRTVAPGNTAPLSPDSLYVVSADWSPDGTQIAFVGGDSTFAQRLYVMAANGSGVTRVSPDSLTLGFMVRWSPAGSTLLFINEHDFWTVGPTGAAPIKIVIPGHSAVGTMTWSPDGSSALVGTENGITGGYDVFRISPTGTILGTFDRPGGQWFEFDWR